MKMTRSHTFALVMTLGALALISHVDAQQAPYSSQTPPAVQRAPASTPSQPAELGQGAPRTIDCPATAAANVPSGSPVGTPQGTGLGSGLTALPGQGAPKQVEGEIKAISSTRTNRIVEVAGLKLEVEPSTTVLMGCKPASLADLKQGMRVKAAYEVKGTDRNMATVIEAQEK